MHKRLLSLLIVMFAVLMPTKLWAQEPYAVLSEENTVLTFYYDNQKEARNGMSVGPFDSQYFRHWDYYREEITAVVFDDSFAKCTSLTSTAYWFYACKKLTSISGISNLKTENVRDMCAMFFDCFKLESLDVSGFITTKVEDMSRLFSGCASLTSLDISNFDTGSVKNMNSMFTSCYKLTSIDVTNFDTSNVTDMGGMFYGCSSLTSLDVSRFNTANVTNMDSMFGECSGLTSLDVSHFNTANVTDMGSMFSGCSSLTSLDVSNFNTRQVTDMCNMFVSCHALTNIDVSKFRTEKVIGLGLSRMFEWCENLTTLDLSGFNTTSVTSMSNMFSCCKKLTTIYASEWWSTEKLEYGQNMFSSCENLVGGAGTSYNSNYNSIGIDYKSSIYARIDGGPNSETPGYFTYKNAPLEPAPYAVLTGDSLVTFYYDNQKPARGGVDICDREYNSLYSSATIADFDSTFTYYQPVSTAYWFSRCSSLTAIRNIERLNTANVTSMQSMFNRCSSLTTLDISAFNTSNVTNMSEMFSGCSGLTSLDVSNFNTANVTDMGSMFSGCSGLTSLDVSHFNTANVTDMGSMFSGCSGLTSLDLNSFNTANVTNMGFMFGDCSGLTSLDVSNLNTANVTDMGSMFSGCSGLTSLDVTHFDTQNMTDLSYMFRSCSGLTSLDLSHFNTANVTDMRLMFYGCSGLTNLNVTGFNTENVTEMEYMFEGCSSLTSLDVSNFKTDNVTDMSGMFSSCSGLTSLDVSNFNTANVTRMRGMFRSCSGLTSLDVSNFNTSNVTEMGGMFGDCDNLTYLNASNIVLPNDARSIFMGLRSLKELNLSNCNTEKMTDMSSMFQGCSNLTSLDLSNFNTANVTDMNRMFYGCSSLLSLDISTFNMKKQGYYAYNMIFSGCENLTYLNASNIVFPNDAGYIFNGLWSLKKLDLSNCNTENVTTMDFMFSSCPNLTTIYAGNEWSTENVVSSVNMFSGSENLKGGAGTTYDPQHIDHTYAHIDGGPDNPGYFTDIADTTAVAEVTFTQEMNELTLQCATPNTTIWYSINSGSSDVQQVSVAEFNAAEVSTDVWYQLTGTVNNLIDGDSYGNFDLEDATGSVYVYGLLAEKGGEKKAFQVLAAEKGIVNGSTITIIGNRGEYGGKIEVTNAYYVDNAGDSDQWQQYTAPLNLSENCTVKAYAARPSGIRSAVSSYDFTVSELPKVETPSFAWEDEKLTISSATEGATIYYSAKECVTEPTGDGTQTSPYNVAAALQYIQSLGADVQSPDSIYVRGIVMKIYDISPQFGNATFYLTDDGKASGKMLYAYRIRDIGNQKFTKENAFVVGDEVIIRGLVVNYKGNTPETVSNSAYIYAYTTPEMNTLYESPLSLSGNNIVRAKATKPGMSDSDMAVMTVGGEEPYAVLVMNNSVAEGDSTAPAPRRADTAMTYTLKFYYDNKKSERGGMSVGPFVQSYDTTTETYYVQGREWEEHVGEITTVEFDQSFSNCNTITNMVGWFFANSQLQTIKGLEYLNTGNVTNMLGLFNGCTSLTSLDLSSFDTHGVTDMRGMFYGCTSLASVNVSSFNTSKVRYFNSMFNNCNSLRSIDVTRFDTKNASSMRMMFRNCRPLESLDISNFETANVKDMYSMFAGCSNVKTIYVGEHWSTESVVVTDSTTYGSYVFSNCASLVGGMGTAYDSLHVDYTYAHIDGGPDNPGYFTAVADTVTVDDDIIQFADANVKAICVSNWDASGDGELSKTEAAAVTTIGTIFKGNTTIGSFNELKYFTGLESLSNSAFEKSTVTSLELPDGLREIGSDAFSQCRQLKSIYIPATVSKMGSDRGMAEFWLCYNLETIVVDENNKFYTSVDNVLFNKEMTKIIRYPAAKPDAAYEIPNTVSAINQNCFESCSYLMAVYIPASVNEMGYGAFQQCSKLVKVTISDGVTMIGEDAFRSCESLDRIHIPASVKQIGDERNSPENVFFWSSALAEITVDENNPYFMSEGGILYSRDKSIIVAYPPALTASEFAVPYGVQKISSCCFTGTKNLTSIQIPETVIAYGSAAINLSDNTLQSLTVMATTPATIEDYAFSDAAYSATLYVPVGTVQAYRNANGWKLFQNIVEQSNVPVDYSFDYNGVLTVGGSATLADALSAAGGREEVAKTITAILWENDMPLTNSDLQGLDNPNLLIYVYNGTQAPDRNNVIIDGRAKNIVLTDAKEGNNNFYCPQAFTAEKVTYTRNFQQQTQVGVSRGWESIALPFTVQTISHESQGTIAPFGNSASGKHFWLRRLGDNGLTQATKMEANVPYLISMPNNSEAYYAEYNLSGKVTFTAQDVTVPVTAPVTLARADSTIKMVPAFQSIGRSSDVWAINVGETRGQYYEGSVFERDYREVRPFEAYTIHRSDTPAPRFVPVNTLMGGTTGIEDVIELMSDDRGEGTWHDLQGRKVANGKLPRGVYIRNGKKTVVR